MTINEALEYINAAPRFGTAGLSRMRELTERLGSVHKGLKFIHIAGSNGKGSCAALLASVLKASGYKTGLYTSPHLRRFTERIRINGREVDEELLAKALTGVKAAADAMEEKPVQFELITAAAMLCFAAENCDIVVLETGMGGRLDATNIIEKPECSVIMNIGLEHTAVLGDTVEKIAEEKAAIIKKGCPCVLYKQSDAAEAVIRGVCAEKGAELTVTQPETLITEFDSAEGQVFTYKDQPYAIALLGEVQRRNAAAAADCIEVLRSRGWKIAPEDAEHGMYAASWPGRFEILSDDPVFVVDGGHNPQGVETVTENLKNYFPGMPYIIIVGVLDDKDYRKMCDVLAGVAAEFVCVTPEDKRALPAETVAEYLRTLGKPVTVCGSVKEGIAAGQDIAQELEGVACAVGSLHMAGDIRSWFGLA